MRKLLVVCTFAICMFASAAHAAELKIGVFNMDKVGRECVAFKELTEKVSKSFEAENKALEKQSADLEKEFNNFKLQQQALTPEAREDRQVELSRKKRDLDDKANNFMRKVGAAEKRMSDDITKVVIYAVQEVSKRDKYTLILEQQQAGAIVVGSAIDINKTVVEEANKVWKQKPKEIFPDGK